MRCWRANAGSEEGITDYAIYMLDPSGIVTHWNVGAERIQAAPSTAKDGEARLAMQR
jgi:hypothetical protein